MLQGKVKDIELKGHTDSVDQLCWDPKHADLIATASGDKTVRLWDARSKSLLFQVSIFQVQKIGIWCYIHLGTSGGKCAQLAELSGENINITYKPDGTHIAVGNRVMFTCAQPLLYEFVNFLLVNNFIEFSDCE